jgi:nicotinate phosphoribosyltransferase
MAPGALLTDLYELNMAASYLRRGMLREATFSLFVRRLPPDRGFLVAAGLEPALEFLTGFHFTDDDLAYLRDELRFDDDVLDAFASLRFEGDVWAIPEGRVVYAGEPLLEITAPMPVAQLVEPYLLNILTFQTTIASKAARCVLAARGRDLIDFSLRRTQGLDAALAVARTTALVGFSATSNVEGARRYGLRPSGTMAHSYIESFPTELDAFRTFAADRPGRITFLVDTYDVRVGVEAAITAIHELGLVDGLGVRIDSGDLDRLSRETRQQLDAAGLPHVRIVASGGLDEVSVAALVEAGAPIDAFGVGTRMGVSADAPYLDSAYKLVEYDGMPMLKLSPGKVTYPGRKQVFRGVDSDVLALRDERAPVGHAALLRPALRSGERVELPGTLREARERFHADLDLVPTEARRIAGPVAPTPTISRALADLTERASADARRRAGV